MVSPPFGLTPSSGRELFSGGKRSMMGASFTSMYIAIFSIIAEKKASSTGLSRAVSEGVQTSLVSLLSYTAGDASLGVEVASGKWM